jgi:hypothetical protein
MSFDVLKEAAPRPEKSNAVCDIGPQVPRVVLASTLPCCTEGLAWIAASEDVHAVTKRSPREGLKIRPDRCRVHESRFHFRNQIADGEGFDLTKSDCAQIWDCSFKSKLNASVSSAQANVCNCFGSIHVSIGSLLQRPPYRSMLSRQAGKCWDGINRFYRSMLAGCRSMLGLRGFRISSFRIPNSVWRMGRCISCGRGS